MAKENTVILSERDDVVVLMTGLDSSANEKTGDMIQVYILHRWRHPIDAIRSGADAAICGDCTLRGEAGKARTCYVRVEKAPSTMWKTYQRGSYRKVFSSEIPDLVRGRVVRLGAYGDPAYMRPEHIELIESSARAVTAYTHQWRRASAGWLSRYAMASVESVADYHTAKSAGWRTFRVARYGDAHRESREIPCPASSEGGRKSKCADCRLCEGAKIGDGRKDIVIQDHSARKKQGLIQISL